MNHIIQTQHKPSLRKRLIQLINTALLLGNMCFIMACTAERTTMETAQSKIAFRKKMVEKKIRSIDRGMHIMKCTKTSRFMDSSITDLLRIKAEYEKNSMPKSDYSDDFFLAFCALEEAFREAYEEVCNGINDIKTSLLALPQQKKEWLCSEKNKKSERIESIPKGLPVSLDGLIAPIEDLLRIMADSSSSSFHEKKQLGEKLNYLKAYSEKFVSLKLTSNHPDVAEIVLHVQHAVTYLSTVITAILKCYEIKNACILEVNTLSSMKIVLDYIERRQIGRLILQLEELGMVACDYCKDTVFIFESIAMACVL